MMNIQLARTFLEVVSAGSMSVAAERLNVTHSTVTVRIKTLEDILRRQVLVRGRNGVTLTADGTRFLEFAESLVRTWQMTRRHMSLASGFKAILSIGIDRTLWDSGMRDWVKKTRSVRPETAIRCERDSSANLMQRLFEGWLDICVVYEAQTRSGFRAERLFDDPLIVVSTENRSPKQWDPQVILIDYDSGVKHQEAMIWGDIDETPHLSVNELAMGLEFIAYFGGSILMPKRLLTASNLPCPLYPVPDQPEVERTAYMVYSVEALKSRMPHLTSRQIRTSLQRQFEGEEVIW
jgi:DNA-binding transcriptional LysR family regulator